MLHSSVRCINTIITSIKIIKTQESFNSKLQKKHETLRAWFVQTAQQARHNTKKEWYRKEHCAKATSQRRKSKISRLNSCQNSPMIDVKQQKNSFQNPSTSTNREHHRRASQFGFEAAKMEGKDSMPHQSACIVLNDLTRVDLIVESIIFILFSPHILKIVMSFVIIPMQLAAGSRCTEHASWCEIQCKITGTTTCSRSSVNCLNC